MSRVAAPTASCVMNMDVEEDDHIDEELEGDEQAEYRIRKDLCSDEDGTNVDELVAFNGDVFVRQRHPPRKRWFLAPDLPKEVFPPAMPPVASSHCFIGDGRRPPTHVTPWLWAGVGGQPAGRAAHDRQAWDHGSVWSVEGSQWVRYCISSVFLFFLAPESQVYGRKTEELPDGRHVQPAHGWAHRAGAGKPRPVMTICVR